MSHRAPHLPHEVNRERFNYNVETSTRFGGLKHRVKTAQSLEERYAVAESIAELEKLVTDTQNLLVHLRAWDNYHPSKK